MHDLDVSRGSEKAGGQADSADAWHALRSVILAVYTASQHAAGVK